MSMFDVSGVYAIAIGVARREEAITAVSAVENRIVFFMIDYPYCRMGWVAVLPKINKEKFEGGGFKGLLKAPTTTIKGQLFLDSTFFLAITPAPRSVRLPRMNHSAYPPVEGMLNIGSFRS